MSSLHNISLSHENFEYYYDDQYIEGNLLSSDFEFLDLDFSDDLSNSASIPSSANGNDKYINYLLKYPNMTPARLAIILNYKDTPQSAYNNMKKKRNYIPQTEEARQKRNLKRRIPHLPKNDFRRLFTTMYYSVINSGDLILFQSFLNRYFLPQSILAKGMLLPSNNHSFLQEKYQCDGLDNIYEYFSLLIDRIPDYVIEPKESSVRINLKNQSSMIVSPFKLTGTRANFQPKAWSYFLSHIISTFTQFFPLSSSSNNSSQIPSSFNQHSSIEKIVQNQTRLQQTPTQELNKDNYFHHFISYMNPLNVRLSSQLKQWFSNVNIFDMIKLFESNRLFPNCFPAIHIDATCLCFIYLNEQCLVTKVELYIEQVNLGLYSKI